MTVRVAVFGAAGRMGRMLVRAVAAEPTAQLSAAVEAKGGGQAGQDAAALAGLPVGGVLVSDDVGAALRASDVVIDFTAPEASVATVEAAADAGVPVVIGTTGLDADQRRHVARAAERIPVVLSSNMSLGVNVVFGLLRQAARALGPEFDFEIVELHHRLKKDAPSGTALSMAAEVAQVRGQALDQVARHGRSGQVGARADDEIGVLAVRGGDVVGEHTAYFFGAGERVEISHRATSRETFARGAVRAALWLPGRVPGLHDMQDVLGLRR